ncbi:DUF2339 domain-containing protein [Marichromatium sp. AB31]|uniref:DUF2339 domain-containing protein n=1 Tax=Marichromatium sp. AB31 TaxID=2483362 RepID=UPI000F3B5D6E|nr:DUF2339 domain-containing protein [Marichromatium sp. AB31]RNE89120.1 DUF2339 domain-containing protein [Marichromatium sp. AB31]
MALTLILTLVGLAGGLWLAEAGLDGLAAPLIGALFGFVLARQQLLERMLREQLGRATPSPAEPQPEPAQAPDSEPLSLDLPAPPPTPPRPTPAPRAPWRLRERLLGANPLVRIGILLVFVGTGFLIKYAVDQQWLRLSLELRLGAIALAALGLLGLGWRVCARNRDYGLLLQGAAIGILYLDVHGAHVLAGLLGPVAAFALLALIALVCLALALTQEARSLAWFGLIGGFLAPLISADGGGDPVVLFGYYALLDTLVLALAWARGWRALNLLGFAFTFVIGIVWGVLRYEPALFHRVEPFLIYFFLVYVAVTVLHARHRPPGSATPVDATLVFGTPLLTLACQLALVAHLPWGEAYSTLAMGLFYLVLAGWLRRDGHPATTLLAQTFLALAVILLSLTPVFALEAELTAGFWALEGAAMAWIGARQEQTRVLVFALLLQLGAALTLPFAETAADPRPFLGAEVLGALTIALAGLVSAYWFERARPWCRALAPWLIGWGALWWLGAGAAELWRLDPGAVLPARLIGYTLLGALLAELAATRLRWARLDALLGGLPLLGLVALAASAERLEQPFGAGGALAWPAFVALGYLLLWRVERRALAPRIGWGLFAQGLTTLLVLDWGWLWWALVAHQPAPGWHAAALALLPAVALLLATRARPWPLTWARVHVGALAAPLALGLALWSIWSTGIAGGSAPWPRLPLVNPLDLVTALVLIALWRWWRALETHGLIAPGAPGRRAVTALFGVLGFGWLNLVLLRALHHAWGVDYRVAALLDSAPTQMVLSVSWGLCAVVLLLGARRWRSRALWFGAAAVLTLAVVKLFAIDLAARGGVERIVSFLAVGGLMMGIGWLTPLPPRATTADETGLSRPSSRTRQPPPA